MLTQGQGAEILHRQGVFHLQVGEELGDHYKGLFIGYHSHLGIGVHKRLNRCGVVRLHMLHHQVVRLTAGKGLLYILQPFLCLTGVDGVHNCHLLVQNHIGIIGHTVGNNVLSLKQVYITVIFAHI